MNVLYLMVTIIFYYHSKIVILTNDNFENNKYDGCKKCKVESAKINNRLLLNQNKNINPFKKRRVSFSNINDHDVLKERVENKILSNENLQKNEETIRPSFLENKNNKNYLCFTSFGYDSSSHLTYNKPIIPWTINRSEFIYNNFCMNLDLMLEKLFTHEYFTSTEMLKIILTDYFIENKKDLILNKNGDKYFPFDDIFQTNFFNKTFCKQLKGNINLLFEILKKGKEKGHFNENCILPYNEAYFMLEKVFDKLIMKIRKSINEIEKRTDKVNAELDLLKYLDLKLNNIKQKTVETFIYSCILAKSDDHENLTSDYLKIKETYESYKQEFIELTVVQNINFKYKHLSKILTCYDIMGYSIRLYSFTNWYNEHKDNVMYSHIKNSKFDDIGSVISELIISILNFIFDESFYLQMEETHVFKNSEYWKILDLKKYFDLEEFWFFDEYKLKQYLNSKISIWKNEIENNFYPDLNKIEKVQKFIKDKIVRKRIIDFETVEFWLNSIDKLILEIKKSDKNRQ